MMEQQQQLRLLFKEFTEVFCGKLGRTKLVRYEIYIEDAKSICKKSYCVPYAKRALVEKELQDMMDAEVVQLSTSPWTSPIVLVEKQEWRGLLLC